MDQNYYGQNMQNGNGWQYQNGTQQYQNATQQVYAQQAQNQQAFGPNYGQQYAQNPDPYAQQPYAGGAQNVYGNDMYSNANGLNNNFYDDGSTIQGPTEGVMAQLAQAMAQEVIAKSFLYMVAALLVTAVAAFSLRDTMYMWARENYVYIIIAELAVAFGSNFAIRKGNTAITAILFTVYSYLTGMTLGVILAMYTGASVASVFVITAVTFGVMAIYGLVTDADLSSVGSLCMMALFGIILGTVVNLFLHNTVVDMILTWIGIAVFVALTAYDTQKIKKRARYDMGESVGLLALVCAFELYLDFINLFLRLLRVMGKRR